MGGPGSGGKPRAYPREIVELATSLYLAGATVAEVQRALPRGFKAQRILERHLPARRPAAKRNQRGAANHMWRADSAGYQAAHLRVASTNGPASAHACTDCGEPADDWSYNHTDERSERRRADGTRPYSPSPTHYSPRCRTCHRAFDRAQKEVMPHVS